MIMRGKAAAFALALGAAATSGQATAQAAKSCVTVGDAEALVASVAPDALRATGLACATVLPPSALIRQTTGPLIDSYQAEADRAWPVASGVIGKFIGPDLSQLADSSLLRPMVATLLVPMIVGKVKPKDCKEIDRVVTLMAPLPPRNVAALLVTIYRLSDQDKPGKKPPLKLCPAG